MSEVLARSEKLREKMTLQNLFHLICGDGSKVAARWLEKDEEKSVTFAEYEAKTYAVAAFLRSALGERYKGKFIGIQADTCPEWFYLFWGVMAAGYNAVLMDFTLSDEMTAYILGQAGAIAVIGKAARKLPDTIAQFTIKQLSMAQEAKGFKPDFGDMVALCTSGTTARQPAHHLRRAPAAAGVPALPPHFRVHGVPAMDSLPGLRNDLSP